MEIHARVERWALDEVAVSGKLFHQMIGWLYRENRLCRGILNVRDKRVGPLSLSVPTLAVVNTADEVAPLSSIKPFIDFMPTKDARIIVYPAEIGVCLQHVGILVGHEARNRVWPEVIPGSIPTAENGSRRHQKQANWLSRDQQSFHML